MKKSLYLFTTFILVALALTTSLNASPIIKESIFKLEDPRNGSGSSTAFLIKEGLVTTLHSVLPKKDLKIGKFSDIQATIGNHICLNERVVLIKAIPEMDLALLSRPKNCSAKDLIAKTDNNNNKLALYGFPLSMNEILDSEVKVRGMGLKPASIYLPTSKRRGPYQKTNIISLEKHMLPGHSGAPLINSGDQVVAIANGGIQGTPVSWAIPWPSSNQWLEESGSVIADINNLIHFPRSNSLYHSITSTGAEIIIIEFSNGHEEEVPVKDNTIVTLGEISGYPTLIKKGYSNQVLNYNLPVKQQANGSNKRFASGTRREFNFFRKGRELFLEIKPPEVSTDANYIYDHVNKLMWMKRVISKPWTQAKSYVHSVNTQQSFEHSDWRLPSRGELITLSKIAKSNPQLINNTSDWYWSSNESSFLGRAIIVNGGNVPGRNELSLTHAVDKNMSVRLVRSFR